MEISVAKDAFSIQDATMTVVGFLLPVTFAACSDFVVEGMKFGELQRWTIALLVVDLIGATSYILRWPERWFPGRFDFIGNGHQIMHVMLCIECYLQMRILRFSAEKSCIAKSACDASL